MEYSQHDTKDKFKKVNIFNVVCRTDTLHELHLCIILYITIRSTKDYEENFIHLNSRVTLTKQHKIQASSKWRQLLRPLTDGSHPSSTQEHSSELSVPPVVQTLQLHHFEQPLAVTDIPLSSENSPTVYPSLVLSRLPLPSLLLSSFRSSSVGL